MFKVTGTLEVVKLAKTSEDIKGFEVQAQKFQPGFKLEANEENVRCGFCGKEHPTKLYFWSKFLGYDFPNGNGDAIPRRYAAEFGPSFISRHLDVNHVMDPQNIIGRIESTWHVEIPLQDQNGPDGKVIGSVTKMYNFENPITGELQVEGVCMIDRTTQLGDDIAHKLISGVLKSVSQEASTEYCACSVCGHKMTNPYEPICAHIQPGSLMLKSYDVEDPTIMSAAKQELATALLAGDQAAQAAANEKMSRAHRNILAYKIHHNPVGTGLAVVTVPAYDKAQVRELIAEMKAGRRPVQEVAKEISQQEAVHGQTPSLLEAAQELNAFMGFRMNAQAESALRKLNGVEALQIMSAFKDVMAGGSVTSFPPADAPKMDKPLVAPKKNPEAIDNAMTSLESLVRVATDDKVLAWKKANAVFSLMGKLNAVKTGVQDHFGADSGLLLAAGAASGHPAFADAARAAGDLSKLSEVLAGMVSADCAALELEASAILAETSAEEMQQVGKTFDAALKSYMATANGVTAEVLAGALKNLERVLRADRIRHDLFEHIVGRYGRSYGESWVTPEIFLAASIEEEIQKMSGERDELFRAWKEAKSSWEAAGRPKDASADAMMKLWSRANDAYEKVNELEKKQKSALPAEKPKTVGEVQPFMEGCLKALKALPVPEAGIKAAEIKTDGDNMRPFQMLVDAMAPRKAAKKTPIAEYDGGEFPDAARVDEAIAENPQWFESLRVKVARDKMAEYGEDFEDPEMVKEFIASNQALVDKDARYEIETQLSTDNSEMQWEDALESLDELLKRFGTSTWKAEGRELGWQNRSGYKEFKAADARSFLRAIFPNTDVHFEIYDEGKYIHIVCYHHDSPTGEFYDVYPLKAGKVVAMPVEDIHEDKSPDELTTLIKEWEVKMRHARGEERNKLGADITRAKALLKKKSAKVGAMFMPTADRRNGYWAIESDGKIVYRVKVADVCGKRFNKKVDIGGTKVALLDHVTSEAYGQDIVAHVQAEGVDAVIKQYEVAAKLVRAGSQYPERLSNGKWRDSNGNSYESLREAAEAEAHTYMDPHAEPDSPAYHDEHRGHVNRLTQESTARYQRAANEAEGLAEYPKQLPSGRWRDSNGNSYRTRREASRAEKAINAFKSSLLISLVPKDGDTVDFVFNASKTGVISQVRSPNGVLLSQSMIPLSALATAPMPEEIRAELTAKIKAANEDPQTTELREAPKSAEAEPDIKPEEHKGHKDVMPLLQHLEDVLQGSDGEYLGEWRYSDANDSGVFRVMTPELSIPVTILVSMFDDGSVALRPFQGGAPQGSDAHGTSEMDAYENLASQTFEDSGEQSQREMVAEVEYWLGVIDKYAQSWQDGGEMEASADINAFRHIKMTAKAKALKDQDGITDALLASLEANLEAISVFPKGYEGIADIPEAWRMAYAGIRPQMFRGDDDRPVKMMACLEFAELLSPEVLNELSMAAKTVEGNEHILGQLVKAGHPQARDIARFLELSGVVFGKHYEGKLELAAMIKPLIPKTMDVFAGLEVLAHIRKRGDKWVVTNKAGDKTLGTYGTEEEAKKRLRQIEYFKHQASLKANEKDILPLEEPEKCLGAEDKPETEIERPVLKHGFMRNLVTGELKPLADVAAVTLIDASQQLLDSNFKPVIKAFTPVSPAEHGAFVALVSAVADELDQSETEWDAISPDFPMSGVELTETIPETFESAGVDLKPFVDKIVAQAQTAIDDINTQLGGKITVEQLGEEFGDKVYSGIVLEAMGHGVAMTDDPNVAAKLKELGLGDIHTTVHLDDFASDAAWSALTAYANVKDTGGEPVKAALVVAKAQEVVREITEDVFQNAGPDLRAHLIERGYVVDDKTVGRLVRDFGIYASRWPHSCAPDAVLATMKALANSPAWGGTAPVLGEIEMGLRGLEASLDRINLSAWSGEDEADAGEETPETLASIREKYGIEAEELMNRYIGIEIRFIKKQEWDRSDVDEKWDLIKSAVDKEFPKKVPHQMYDIFEDENYHSLNEMLDQLDRWERKEIDTEKEGLATVSSLQAAAAPKCDQCDSAYINGVYCHEHGCPNRNKVWDEEAQEWVTPEQEEDLEAGLHASQAFDQWIDTFIAEKGIDPEEMFEFEGASGHNDMPYGVVIEHMKIASPQEQMAIKNMIVKLDFKNADIRDYLRHLGKALDRGPEDDGPGGGVNAYKTGSLSDIQNYSYIYNVMHDIKSEQEAVETLTEGGVVFDSAQKSGDGFVTFYKGKDIVATYSPETGNLGIINAPTKESSLELARKGKLPKEDTVPVEAAQEPIIKPPKKDKSEYDKAAVEKGIPVEMEHTSDRALAENIVMNHLDENPDYYKAFDEKAKGKEELVKMEAGAEPQSLFLLEAAGEMLQKGNEKISNSSEGGTYSFGLPAGETCPNARECSRDCFAKHGQYRMNPDVINLRQRNYELSKDAKKFTEALEKEIGSHKKVGAIRIHDSGDFYSPEYLKTWLDFAKAHPDIRFYAYTKSIQWVKDAKAEGRVPENFKFIYSYGGKEDALIDPEKDIHSKVFPDVDTLKEAGYTDASWDESLASHSDTQKMGLIRKGSSVGKTSWGFDFTPEQKARRKGMKEEWKKGIAERKNKPAEVKPIAKEGESHVE